MVREISIGEFTVDLQQPRRGAFGTKVFDEVDIFWILTDHHPVRMGTVEHQSQQGFAVPVTLA